MPRFYKRRTSRRRRRKPRRRRKMRRVISIVPNTKFVKLSMSFANTFTTPAGSQISLGMNDMFDPTGTISSAQPVGFDQWMNFYQKFEVMASKISVHAYQEGTTAGAVIALFPSVTSSPTVTPDASKSQPFVVWKTLAGAATGNQYARLNKYMKIRYFEGRSTASVNYTGSADASPSDKRHWIISVFAFDLSTAINVRTDIKITYYAKLYRRINLSDS